MKPFASASVNTVSNLNFTELTFHSLNPSIQLCFKIAVSGHLDFNVHPVILPQLYTGVLL